MKNSVNISALLGEVLNIEQAAEETLCATLFIDESAPADLQAYVRASFLCDAPNSRVSISYFPTMPVIPFEQADVAVVVAGLDPSTGRVVADLQDKRIPTLVVTSLPGLVCEIAEHEGYPIDERDIIAPFQLNTQSFIKELLDTQESDSCTRADSATVTASAYVSAGVHSAEVPAAGMGTPTGAFGAPMNSAFEESQVEAQEPYALTPEIKAEMNTHMAQWLIQAVPSKRLALAFAFPVVRRPLCMDIVKATSLQNAGIGVVSIIPGSDLPLMTANQIKMILQIAAVHGQKINAMRLKEILCVCAGGFACRTAARELTGLVPVLGWLIKGGIGYSGTFAMGKTAIEYFEGNGALEPLLQGGLSLSKQALSTYQQIRSNPHPERLAAKTLKLASKRLSSKSADCLRAVQTSIKK